MRYGCLSSETGQGNISFVGVEGTRHPNEIRVWKWAGLWKPGRLQKSREDVEEFTSQENGIKKGKEKRMYITYV